MKQNIKICSLAMALCLMATGCQSAEQTAQTTQDSLSAPSLAQQTMEQVAANGKTYAYKWEAEDVEATMQLLEEEIAQAESGIGSISLPQGDENLSTSELIANRLNEIRQALEKEHALQPVVSAQEAANIAGAVLEGQYGADFSVAPMTLTCYEGDTALTTQPNPNTPTRLVWFAYWEDGRDGWFPNTCAIVLDATTGEIVSTNSYLSQTQSDAYKAAPAAACIDKEMRILNDQDPTYEATKEALLQNAAQLLDGSPLLGGATTQSMTLTNDALKGVTISFDTSTGKKGCLIVTYPDPDFGFDGFPMRAYRYENTSWFEAFGVAAEP